MKQKNKPPLGIAGFVWKENTGHVIYRAYMQAVADKKHAI